MAIAAILRSRRPLFSFPYLSLAYSSSSSSCTKKPHSLPLLKPPIPKKFPFAVSAHGKIWGDPYHWMSKTEDPHLIDYLNRENSYAEAFMADTEDLQQRLVAEMKGRMPARVSTPPESWGDWYCFKTLVPTNSFIY